MELSLAEDLPPIHCDPAKLQRAFGELIENAISFQPDGGDLRVETRRIGPEDRRKLHLAEGRSYVLAEFADRGPGVAAALKERIFQPFFTSRAKGMGLGLSIVKGIVEAHHGILRETGAEGEGARFAVYLPVNGT
jgi:signal transduction histidine kinase